MSRVGRSHAVPRTDRQRSAPAAARMRAGCRRSRRGSTWDYRSSRRNIERQNVTGFTSADPGRRRRRWRAASCGALGPWGKA